MGRITCVVGPEMRSRIYDEGAALPYRGMSVLSDVVWDDVHGLHFMEIVTDQTPPGPAGQGHYDAYCEGGRIKFKRDCDV